MGRHANEADVALFANMAKIQNLQSAETAPFHVLAPAFMISELKRAFEIGFMVFLPFLVIDLVVSSILMAMGMMMLPPVTISLPFKLIFFVLVDGWRMLAGLAGRKLHGGAPDIGVLRRYKVECIEGGARYAPSRRVDRRCISPAAQCALRTGTWRTISLLLRMPTRT